VFDDFFGAAEYLIANHYTTPQKLAITGRSNGGLLMGAAMTQRPDLYAAIVCGYPLLDMVRYDKFLVAKYWVPEYGTADNAAQFPALYAYSPYHHVVKGTKYPAVLFLTGDSDTRVAPLHARKMTALMQASQGGDKPILLLYDTKLGHSEGRPVSKIIEEDSDVLSFFFWQVGVHF
jgi:prolyl oligopeptidase